MFLKSFTLLLPLQKKNCALSYFKHNYILFLPFIVEIIIVMNISLFRRCPLNHKKLRICVSDVTAVSFFGSIAETGNLDMRITSYLLYSPKSAIKSEYKPPIYRLWQYLVKNKSSLYNDVAICHNNKQYFNKQRISVSCLLHLKKIKSAPDYITQSILTPLIKWLLLKSKLSFHNLHNSHANRCSVSSFILPVCITEYMIKFAKNIFRNDKIYGRKKWIFETNNFTSFCNNSVWQYSENSHKIGTYIGKISYRWVCGS